LLQRLLPEDVARLWELIRAPLEASLPPTAARTVGTMTKVLEGLSSGRLLCWLELKEDERKVSGLVTTAVVADEFSGTKNLLIYTLWSDGTNRSAVWREDIEILKKYARSIGCAKIIAFTDKNQVESIADKLGARIGSTLIEFDLEPSLSEFGQTKPNGGV
jgi:hypothetical protein